MNLSSTIKSIQDIMRKDDGVDGDAQRLGQLTWMLFLKVFDQREIEWEDNSIQEGKKYISPIPEEYRWRNWAEMTVDAEGKKSHIKSLSEVISFINNELFPSLKDINANESRKHKVVRSVFEDSNNYMKSGHLFLAVLEKLEDAIDIDDFKVRANLGDVYEQLLNDLRGAGNAGEFYTPRAITQFMVQMVSPQLEKNEVVLDPACGTGGFLSAAIDHFLTQTNLSKEEKLRKAESLITGFEKKSLPHLLCSTNMLIHGLDVPDRITRMNTLGRGWNKWEKSDQADCVITNPPFGGSEEDRVGGDYPPHLRSRETADMFMSLLVKKLLKEGGRAAVVLPDGFMFGDGIKHRIKEELLKHCKLHTVIRLPKGVFAPYTTIKSNLLFFTKKEQVDDVNEQFATETIWFYEHQYPKGYKSYSKTKPIRLEEFDVEKEWWGTEDNDFSEREENEFAWKVDFKTKRSDALAGAQPHWDKADALNNQAKALEDQARNLKASLKGIGKTKTEKAHRQDVEKQISDLQVKAEPLRIQAKDAKAAGDRVYWPIFDLSLKNPNSPEEESHDPDVLLEKLKKVLSEIEETENTLKSELAAALSHHFGDEESDTSEEETA